MSYYKQVSMILSLLGIGLSIYLTFYHLSYVGVCPGGGCASVLSSSFSKFLGIPLPIIGLGFFLLTLGLDGHRPYHSKDPHLLIVLIGVTFAGVCVSIFLLGVQVFYLKKLCIFCILIEALVFGLFGMALANLKKTELSFSFSSFMKGIISHYLLLPSLFFSPIIIFSIGQWGLFLFLSSKNQIVSVMDGRKYRIEDIDRGLGASYHQAMLNLNHLRREWLDQKVLELEGHQRGKKKEELLMENVLTKISLPRGEISNYYVSNFHRFRGRPFNEVRPSIINELYHQKNERIQFDYIDSLKKKHGITYKLPQYGYSPVGENSFGSPAIGSTSAPIQIIEFVDIKCSHCREAHHYLDSLISNYPDQIYLTYRFYPITKYPLAEKLAEIGACAQIVGVFWEFLTTYYDEDRDEISDLDTLYAAMGENKLLDIDKIKRCVRLGKGSALVNEDLKAGSDAGIGVVPVFFINGERIDGIHKLRNRLSGLIIRRLQSN